MPHNPSNGKENIAGNKTRKNEVSDTVRVREEAVVPLPVAQVAQVAQVAPVLPLVRAPVGVPTVQEVQEEKDERPLLFSDIIFNGNWIYDGNQKVAMINPTMQQKLNVLTAPDHINHPVPCQDSTIRNPSILNVQLDPNTKGQLMIQQHQRVQHQRAQFSQEMLERQILQNALQMYQAESQLDLTRVNLLGAIGQHLPSKRSSGRNSPIVDNQTKEFLLFGAPDRRTAQQRNSNERFHNYNICGFCHSFHPIYHCFNCSESMCHSCSGMHNLKPNCKIENLHQICQQYSLQPSVRRYVRSPNSPDYDFCDIHNDNFSYVCRDCRIIICQDCSFDEHNLHKSESIGFYISNTGQILEEINKAAILGQENIKRFIDLVIMNQKHLERETTEISRMRKSNRPDWMSFIMQWCDDNNLLFNDVLTRFTQKIGTLYIEQQNTLRTALAGISSVTTNLKNFEKTRGNFTNYKLAKVLIDSDHQIHHFATQARNLNLSKISMYDYICHLEKLKQDTLIAMTEPNAPIKQIPLSDMKNFAGLHMDMLSLIKSANQVNNGSRYQNNRRSTPRAHFRNYSHPNYGHSSYQYHHHHYQQRLQQQQELLQQHIQAKRPQYVSVPALSMILPLGNAVFYNTDYSNYHNPLPYFNMDVMARNIPKSEPLEQFGYDGSAPGELSRPWGICSDKDGNIIIGDRRNNRIQIFSHDGKLKTTFGRKGHDPGEFELPAGITVDRYNRIIVADKDNHRIQVFSGTGHFIMTFGKNGRDYGEFQYPWDVATNSLGEIAVSDTRNHRVQLFTNTGHFVTAFCFDDVFDHTFGANTTPRGLCFTPQNEVIVTDFENHRVIKLDPHLTHIIDLMGYEGNDDRELNRPSGICCDSNGRIIIADSKNQRVQVYGPKFEFICSMNTRSQLPQFMHEKDRPCDVTILKNGSLAVVFETSPDTKDMPHPMKTFVKIY